jgi:hypothetical protein
MARLQDIFVKNLKKIRRKSGFTQARFAEKVNVSAYHIGMTEISRNYPTGTCGTHRQRSGDRNIRTVYRSSFSQQRT